VLPFHGIALYKSTCTYLLNVPCEFLGVVLRNISAMSKNTNDNDVSEQFLGAVRNRIFSIGIVQMLLFFRLFCLCHSAGPVTVLLDFLNNIVKVSLNRIS